MKKTVQLLVVACALVAFVACGENKAKTENENADSTKVENVEGDVQEDTDEVVDTLATEEVVDTLATEETE